jgi:RNA polymerase sigma factor (sigma-70 family)
MLREKHLAEDAAQEACVVLYRSIAGLRSAAAFRTWFYRIVVREASTIRRRRERVDDAIEDRGVSVELSDAIDVWRALAQLPDRLRDVVILRYFEDLSSREIATVMGVPDGTVRFWLMHAKRALRPLLDDAIDAVPGAGEVKSHAI